MRVGLATDIELFDSFPSSYLAYSRRQHRWIRGDWQIAAWCTPRVPTPDGWVPNPLSVINRWKILDNLRRSLVPAASVAAPRDRLARPAGRSAGLERVRRPGAPRLTSAATHHLALSAADSGDRRLEGMARRWRELLPAWMRAGLSAALLPHQAAVAIDAIARVAFRRLISRRLLLEWQTSQIDQHSATEPRT